MPRYQVYKSSDKKIIVVSHYAGKAVRGVAKCRDDDNYDVEKGEKLAKLRCDLKIAKKRAARAAKAYTEAASKVAEVQHRFNKMCDYLESATYEVKNLQSELNELEHSM